MSNGFTWLHAGTLCFRVILIRSGKQREHACINLLYPSQGLAVPM